MTLERNSVLLRIFLGELDKYKGAPLYESLVLTAKKEGIAGATVFRGILSYGASSRIHSAKLLEMSVDLPIVVEMVDTREKIDNFLPKVDRMVDEAGGGALITMEAAEVIHYKPRKH